LKPKIGILGLLIYLFAFSLTGCALFQLQGPAAGITRAPTSGDITEIPIYTYKTAAVTEASPTIIPSATLKPTLVITSVPYVVPTLRPLTPTPGPTAAISLTVSKIDMNLDNSTITTTCPPGNTTFTLRGRVWTNKPGNVTYYWEFSNGSKTTQSTILIDSTLNQAVTTTFITNSKGTYWGRIRILSPYDKEFPQITFNLVCQ